jgi:exodeoxyribonuclease VII large subunit
LLHLGHFIKMRQAEYRGTVEKLASLSPLNILGRGYSITFTAPEGKIVKDAASVEIGDCVRTRLHKGEIESKITGVGKDGRDKI